MRREQNNSRWGNCEQMICMFAYIANCTLASLAFFCQVLDLLLAAFSLLVFEGQSKLRSPVLVFYNENMESARERARATVLATVFISAAVSEDVMCREASQQHNPTAAWPWEAGLSLDIS